MFLRRVVVFLLLLCWSGWAGAQQQTVRLAGVVPKERMVALMTELAGRLPGTRFSYDRMSSSQIMAAARRADAAPFDMALLSSPDIAVSIANEGHAARDEIAGSNASVQWRNEVFGLWSDSAVMVLRRDAFPERLPRTRIELVRALEQNGERFTHRIGIVNIGIDDVSYLLASQDSIRTSLYWRLMKAFGGASARIFDTTEDLLDALRGGELDVLYNVPLSSLPVGGGMPEGMEIVVPQDYVLAVPWTVFMPKGAPDGPGARIVLDMLMSREGKPVLAAAGFDSSSGIAGLESPQKIELGPELLVFRDMIKRSRFLDIWFQMVVN